MLVDLNIWASSNFRPAPAINTLRAWAKSGLISPPPIKVGRAWMVDEGAAYVPVSVVSDVSDRVASILRKTA